ncbi:uncharacterized protein LOC132275399 isoform X1 [Cornus florida]|uniref:uncharacterized protein LOC132275399 isoform X1 n=1 Tax=Cornus florida TaxID=4283 RepID=UPI0028A24FBB|nr:uncharacterized protein LOC132275399 isoform X1 [Cornus florida]
MVVPVRRGRSSGGRVRGSDSDSDSFSDLLRNAAIALGLKSVNRQFVSIIDEGSPFWCDDISMKYKKCMKECGDEDCQKYQKTLSVHCRYLNPTASDIEEANRAYDAYMTNNKNECGFLTMMFDKQCVNYYAGDDRAHCRILREDLSRYCQAFEKGGQPTGETVGWWKRIWE